MSKYGVHLSVFSPNAGKYGPEITPYLDSFHAATDFSKTIIGIPIKEFSIMTPRFTYP